MNYKKIIVGFALSLACLSVQQAGAETFSKSKKKENVTAATSINWADGSGKVSYSINATTSPVVKIALRMFSDDMKAVTGNEAKEKASANIQIYQLNLLTNKEFSAVEKLGAPLHKFITAKDAFYIRPKGQDHRDRKRRPRHSLRHHGALAHGWRFAYGRMERPEAADTSESLPRWERRR